MACSIWQTANKCAQRLEDFTTSVKYLHLSPRRTSRSSLAGSPSLWFFSFAREQYKIKIRKCTHSPKASEFYEVLVSCRYKLHFGAVGPRCQRPTPYVEGHELATTAYLKTDLQTEVPRSEKDRSASVTSVDTWRISWCHVAPHSPIAILRFWTDENQRIK